MVKTKYYHGSPYAGLKVLKPHISNHKKQYVYLTTNEVVALFYTVKTDWYTYGFDKSTKLPVFTEYYKDELKDLYYGRAGYIYEVENVEFKENPTNISCAFVTEKEVSVKSELKINNLYDKFLEYEKQHKLIIKKYEDLTDNELNNIKKIVINEIRENNLINETSSYSQFIKEKFPKEWHLAANTLK